MALDLSSLGNAASSGENLPEVLHAVADMVKAKGKLTKFGIGGTALGFDPKKHLAETLDHLGLGAPNPNAALDTQEPAAVGAAAPGAAAPAPSMPEGLGADGSGVNMEHLQEVIQHLRSMGGGGQGQPPFSPSADASLSGMGSAGFASTQPSMLPGESDADYLARSQRIESQRKAQAQADSAGRPDYAGQGTGSMSPEQIAALGQAVPPGAFTQGPDGGQIELNPPGAEQTTAPVSAVDPNAGVTNPNDLKFNFKVDPNGPKPVDAGLADFTGEYQEMDRRVKSKQAELDKLIAETPAKIHGVYHYTDPKTGKEMIYEPPKPVELKKEIGGKKHSFGDWASLGLALVAAAVGGENGQALAVGMLQGWFGGTATLAEQDTAQNEKEFKNAQEARVADAESFMKMIGFKSDEITHLFAHMDRTMNMQMRSEDQKARLEETKARNDDIARRDVFTAVNASKGKYQTALKGMNLEDAKVQAAGWRAAETGLPADQRTAPTDAQVEALINSAKSSFRDKQGASLQKGYLGMAQSAPDGKTAVAQIHLALRYMDPKSDEHAEWTKIAKEIESGAHPWPKEQNFALKVARAHLSTANAELMALGQRASKGEDVSVDWANALAEQQAALNDIDALAQGGEGEVPPYRVTPGNTRPDDAWAGKQPGNVNQAGVGGLTPPKPGPTEAEKKKLEEEKQLRVDAVKKVRELTLHADTYGMTPTEYRKEVAAAKAAAPQSDIRKKDGKPDIEASIKADEAAQQKAVKDLNARLKTEYDTKLDYFKKASEAKEDGKQAAPKASTGPPKTGKDGETWKSPSGSMFVHRKGPKGSGWYRQ